MPDKKDKNKKSIIILGFESREKAQKFAKKYEINSARIESYQSKKGKKTLYRIVKYAKKIV